MDHVERLSEMPLQERRSIGRSSIPATPSLDGRKMFAQRDEAVVAEDVCPHQSTIIQLFWSPFIKLLWALYNWLTKGWWRQQQLWDVFRNFWFDQNQNDISNPRMVLMVFGKCNACDCSRSKSASSNHQVQTGNETSWFLPKQVGASTGARSPKTLCLLMKSVAWHVRSRQIWKSTGC